MDVREPLAGVPAGASPSPPRSWPRSRRGVRAGGRVVGSVVAGVVAALGTHVLAGRSDDTSAPQRKAPVAWQRTGVSASGLEKRLGIRVTEVAVTGGGGLLDLRFQVVDPDRATAIHDPATPPAIVDEASGLVVHDLLMGHAHRGAMKPAVTYYLIFESPANWVHRGSRVTVLLGDAQLEHVVVS